MSIAVRALRAAFCAVLLLPAPVAAQSVSDGVLAIVRGDYALAVRILSPYAEGREPADPLAAFFLGSLYYSGRGVQMDPVVACGLFQKARQVGDSPVAAPADALLRDVSGIPTAFFWELCEQSRREHVSVPSQVTATVPTPAQSAVEKGVDAFVKGDYGVAAQLLAPIAEGWPMVDGAAPFFMGLMYEAGVGAARDDVRACAMYLRSGHNSPVGEWGPNVLLNLHGRLTQEQFEECPLLSSLGFHHGFEPVTITLEPGYWVSMDLRGATVSMHGQEKRHNLGWGSSGALFLPIRYTELLAGPVRNQKRRCVEVAFWVPDVGTDWVLVWQLFEVRGLELKQVAAEQVAKGSARPELASRGSIDDYLRLQVNDAGEPGWALK
jgi:hypothetical protein